MIWDTFIYQIPREPQKNRMAVWRKLKSIGALNVLQSIWILPQTDKSAEEFKKLVEYVKANGGSAVFCKTEIQSEEDNKKYIANFNRERETDYRELLSKCRDFFEEMERETKAENFIFAELEENEQELEKLHNWLKKIEKKDFFHCEFKKTVIEALEKCAVLLNEFSNRVYERDGDFKDE